MSTLSSVLPLNLPGSLGSRVESTVSELLGALPRPEQLSAEERRGIIARYAAVLEGNFIYWMSGAYLAARAESSRLILLSNLEEEIRDCHPGMLRRFTIAAHAFPERSDAMAVSRDLTAVRLFVGRLSGVPIILMMAFFECFIQGFMGFFAELAELQGSKEQQYTTVHGVCDIAHTQELFRVLAMEIELDPPRSNVDLFEGVGLLTTLIRSVVSVRPEPGEAVSCGD
jgi:hypothetical protein